VNIEIEGRPTFSAGVCAPAPATLSAAPIAATAPFKKAGNLMLSSWLSFQLTEPL
jgi:hypothetical protein